MNESMADTLGVLSEEELALLERVEIRVGLHQQGFTGIQSKRLLFYRWLHVCGRLSG